MRYYIRHTKDADVQGSFTTQELIAGVKSGQLSSGCLASSDLGESVESLRHWRDCDWFSLSDIPELRNLLPAKPRVAPRQQRVTGKHIRRRLVSVATSVCLAFMLHHWVMWLAVLAAMFAAVDTIISYVGQQKEYTQLA